MADSEAKGPTDDGRDREHRQANGIEQESELPASEWLERPRNAQSAWMPMYAAN